MKKVVRVIEGILAAVSGVVCLPVLAAMSPVPAVTQDVDPMIGCAKDGHTYPGPTCPFGLVQPGPDSGNGDWAHCSGYVNADDRIFGFSQTHLNGGVLSGYWNCKFSRRIADAFKRNRTGFGMISA